jgi:PhnB protein
MLVAYVSFNGNTEEAFDFYKTALNGTISSLQRFSDSPHGEQMSDADKKKIMHISLEAPNGVRLMGNDYLDFMGQPFSAGNNFSLSLHPTVKNWPINYLTVLSAGGTVTVPMSTAPWGDYFWNV